MLTWQILKESLERRDAGSRLVADALYHALEQLGIGDHIASSLRCLHIEAVDQHDDHGRIIAETAIWFGWCSMALLAAVLAQSYRKPARHLYRHEEVGEPT